MFGRFVPSFARLSGPPGSSEPRWRIRPRPTGEHPPSGKYATAAAPKVSVAMITYNHEKFLAGAIESVLMQQVDFPMELVVGEDCSTDRTGASCNVMPSQTRVSSAHF